MASTYTSNIRLEKQADGENPNSWGALLNTNVIDLVDQAIAAYQIVSVSGTTPLTLSQINGTTDQSRKAILSFDGTLTAETSIIIPSVNKMYYIRNNTSGAYALKVKTVGNTAITIEQGSNIMVATDGTNVYKTAFPTSVSSFTANSLTATSVSTSVLNATKITTSIVSATNIHATSVSAVSGRFSGTVSASAFDGLGNQLNFGSDAQGDILYNNGTNIQNLPAGTSGQFLKTQGSSANPIWSNITTSNVYVETAAFTSLGATAIPLDDTIPQITEGNHITALECSITPSSSGNRIEVDAFINLGIRNAAAGNMVLALFKNSATDAVASYPLQITDNGNGVNLFPIRYSTSVSNTDPIQFSFRAGNNASLEILLNSGGVRQGGGTVISSVKLTEFSQ
jgi:hypothetical protein